MQWKEGEYWLRDAVKYVKFPPDRRKVQEELYEHMLSRNLEFLAEGHSEEEADRLACLSMGDPEEVGRALAEVHKPFWGYFLRTLRILLAAILLMGIIVTIRGWRGGDFGYYRRTVRNFVAYDAVWIRQDAARRCGDYRFRLRRAAVAGPGLEGGFIPEEQYNLVLELRAFTWDPNLGPPDYATPYNTAMTLTVEDSLGNRYPAHAHCCSDWIFFSDVLVHALRFDPAAEWAVLVLEAGDRELRFPVTLKEATA